MTARTWMSSHWDSSLLPPHGPSRAATEENVTGFQHLGLPLNQRALRSREGRPSGPETEIQKALSWGASLSWKC